MSEHITGVADLISRSSVENVEVDPMDPKTWFNAQLGNQKSWIGFSGATTDHQIWLSGVQASKVLTNAENNVNLAAAVAAYYGMSAANAGVDTYDVEAEALGQKLIFGEGSIPTIDYREPFISKPEDIRKIKSPSDWLSKGRVKLHWDIYKLTKFLGSTNGMYCSPFSLAVQMRSYPLLVRDMRRNPAFVHEFLSLLVDEILPSYLKAQQEYTGLNLCLGAAAWQSFPNLTTDMIEEFVVPYDLRLMQNCMQFGMMAIQIGGADYCEENPAKMEKDTLYKCFDLQVKMAGGQPSLFLLMGRTQDIPIEWIVEYLNRYKKQGIRATFTVEINARVMRDGPTDVIQSVIKRYIQNIAPDHNLSMFGITPSDTPSKHIHTAVAAARAYGTYPISEDLNHIEVKVPKHESFAEYVNRMSNGKGLQI